MKKSILIIVAIIAFFFHSCQKETSNEAQNQEEVLSEEDKSWIVEEETAPLSQRIPFLIDTIQVLKSLALASEKEKINTTKMFIEEVESTLEEYDYQLIARLKTVRNEAEQTLYSEATMQDTVVMLLYDDKCTEMVDLLTQIANETPSFEKYTRSNLLITDVRQAFNQDFFIRKNYNSLVYELNQLITNQKEEIIAINPNFDTLEVLPYFYEEPIM